LFAPHIDNTNEYPDRGQGLNHAIQDAYNLVNILTKHYAPSSTSSDLSSELQSYANEVSIRGAEEVRLTKQNAYMVLDWRSLEQSPVFKHALDRSPVVDKKEEKEVETAQKEVTAMAGA